MKNDGQSLLLSASDLVGFLNCRHLTQLDRLVALGELPKPFVWDPMLDVLRERGFRHEQAYIDHLEREGRQILKLPDGHITDEAVEVTRQAMTSGVDVIVQAALRSGRWIGRADVLLRVDSPSQLGAWSYEPLDTKLARETKAGTILQLCLYSDLLAAIQGTFPEQMHVVPPWQEFEPESWRVADFAAFYRQAKAALELATGPAPVADTYPEPNSHCDVCRWRLECTRKRKVDDHLSLIAGISRLQMAELTGRGIPTLAATASIELPLRWKAQRGSVASYEKIREQARVQLESRLAGELKFELLPIEAGIGLARLPKPSPGDVFLDFESDPFVGEHGLEYLFGYQFSDDHGAWNYYAGWALEREAEKREFERFIDFVSDRLQLYPDLHIYHYGGYETGALKRLMGRYATRQDELDDLLRGERFVDLLTVVRHAIRAGVESYSIKKLEPLYGFDRGAALPDANLALCSLQTSLELELEPPAEKDLATVEAYNRDDCVSTRLLRDWLEAERAKLIEQGCPVERPQIPDAGPSEELSERLARVAALVEALTHDVPADLAQRTPEQQARWILAQLLDWHRREAKAAWWEFFRLRDLLPDDLLDERAGLTGLVFEERVGGTERCPIHRYRFPPQEADIRRGKPLKRVGGTPLGSVEDIDLQDLWIDIKKRQDTADFHPNAAFVHEVIGSQPMEDSLLRLAEHVRDHGIEGEGPYRAARELLLRQAPVIADGEPLRLEHETPLDTAVRIASRLNGSTLPIQGPPGAGKTFTGARMICELLRRGKRIGIVANSHAVIRNLLDGVVREAEKLGIDVQCVQKPDDAHTATDRISIAKNAEAVFAALDSDCHVAAGTAWLWASSAAFRSVDVLFVDEAAQMSLANVVAVAQAADSVVLLGDPQQLDQPTQGSHPEGADGSALVHILGNQQTIHPEQGLFLEETWRLHPSICEFTSELFYEGKLRPRPNLFNQNIGPEARIPQSGLCYIPVEHAGNQNSSPEEAAAVADLVGVILASGATWTDAGGSERPITENDILVIAPYNAQVHEIHKRLPLARVGTVDKFQGQEAPIAIYSLSTSSHADAPRGMEFLYSLNRLNVATSRARCVSIIVASPALFEVDCKTPQQMRLANAFCRFLELASGQA